MKLFCCWAPFLLEQEMYWLTLTWTNWFIFYFFLHPQETTFQSIGKNMKTQICQRPTLFKDCILKRCISQMLTVYKGVWTSLYDFYSLMQIAWDIYIFRGKELNAKSYILSHYLFCFKIDDFDDVITLIWTTRTKILEIVWINPII